MAKRASKRQTRYTPDASTRILVLFGEDEMSRKSHLDELREAHGDPEVFHFDGTTATLAEVFDELRSYSLMQTYKIVMVDPAQDFVSNHRDALERYWPSPVDHATLVLVCQSWPGNTKLAKALSPEVGGAIACDAPTAQEAERWLVSRAKSHHRTALDAKAANLLVQRLGPHLMKLDTELAKLALLAGEGRPIDVQLIQQTVEKSSDESAWMVQKAVLEGLANADRRHAMHMIHELIDLSGQPPVLVLFFVADLMRKLSVARMKLAAGESRAAIAKSYRLFGEQQALFFKTIDQWSPADLAQLFDRIINLDAGSKSGLGKPTRNLECFVASMA